MKRPLRLSCRAFTAVLFAAAILIPTTALAETLGNRLSIGQGWALANETRLFQLRPGVQEVTLANLPESVDLSTLQFRHRRVPVELLSWRRVGEPASPRHPSLRQRGDRVTWMALGPDHRPTERERRAVVCSIRSGLSGAEPLQVAYLLSGFSWRAHYQLAVRGDLTDERDPVSIDLVGRVAISNGTDRTYPNAALTLLSGFDNRPPDPRRRAGWLSIPPFGTLTHFWPEPPEDLGAAPFYRLAVRADLAAQAVSEVEFAATRRAPARRVYAVSPTLLEQSRNAPVSMERLVVIDNQPAVGLGFAMPPGEAEIYLGGIGVRLWTRGDLPNTDAGQRIQVNLGPTDEVTVRLRHLGTERLATGNFEETYEIHLNNRLDSPVLTEVRAIPEAVTTWNVTRSSHPFQRDGRRLIWTPTVEGRSALTLRYQLRVQAAFEPSRDGPDQQEGGADEQALSNGLLRAR